MSITPPQPIKDTEQEEYRQLIDFLHGRSPWKGRWFGDKPSGTHGAFWWRREMDKIINNYINQQVLSALNEVKSKAMPYQTGDDLGEVIDANLVDVADIEEIEKRYV